MRSTRILVSFAVMAAVSCTRENEAPADTAAAAPPDTAAVVVPDTVAAVSPDSARPPAAGSNPSAWLVTTKGIGPISAGMTVAEANAAAGTTLVVPAAQENECSFARLKGGPPDLMFMVERGKVSRVDVTRSSTIATTEGAKIGDSEDRIKSLYPGVVVQPHKYTDGHYLVVTPAAAAAAAARNFRIVFETDGAKVLRYRSGLMPAVEYVEGCS